MSSLIVVVKSSSLISLFISASDVLLNLLPANLKVLLCFYFLYFVVFNNLFTTPVGNENARLKLALAISTGAPITVANDATEMPWLGADKKKKYIY